MANKKLEQSNMKPLMILEEKKVLITMQSTKNEVNKGAWTREEDQKLAEVIAVHGAKKWKTIATIAGSNSSADQDQDSNCSSTSDFDVNDFFDFSTEGPTNLEWMSRFLDRGESF
ncbi:hypothetical protein TIFTF001_006377 [Ficus carica]|uniref:MYB transcription factor n=1 Tax=Ficus carica TaxID=3494 RepID=A0AA87ZP49_FICCA|nr:hypothetical protein TIFTF001_006377 [Ficus carica]